jgi:hypothetical protein
MTMTLLLLLLLVMMSFCGTCRCCHAKSSSLPQRKPPNDDDNDDECTLYLAPSTIPGAGLGMFAGSRSFRKHERMADPDLMVPVYELDWHNGDDTYSFLWDEYTWSACA